MRGIARGTPIVSTRVCYTFVVASGFLCDPGDSGSCPGYRKVNKWRRLRNQRHGDFRPAGQVGKGSRDVQSQVDEWMISFDSYGIAPAAFMQRGPAFGRPQTGSKRLPMGSGSLPTSGLAIFRILLTPMSGTTKAAVLQVNCALCPGNVLGRGFALR
jgi:hypothetical protein